ncbi:CIC11C00000005313 [Sungouiella intermedia]|uniref:CIC11C00000005313 n=1 Tax=Sungouiella intermedia TaxID=45354 RepID=A0A1L0C1J8_9ASCO|nr:CIC11C00000005313 [[Candida] intermedia]
MNFSHFLTFVFVASVVAALDFDLARDFFHLKRADGTTSSSSSSTSTLSSLSKSDTTVWVTITTNGALATVKTIYTQSFMSTYITEVDAPSSGNVGMGSISGNVGSLKEYSKTTITNGGNGNRNFAYGGAAGALLVAVGML